MGFAGTGMAARSRSVKPAAANLDETGIEGTISESTAVSLSEGSLR
jgi:hypothetical protein